MIKDDEQFKDGKYLKMMKGILVIIPKIRTTLITMRGNMTKEAHLHRKSQSPLRKVYCWN
jgi:hypothetical protein